MTKKKGKKKEKEKDNQSGGLGPFFMKHYALIHLVNWKTLTHLTKPVTNLKNVTPQIS